MTAFKLLKGGGKPPPKPSPKTSSFVVRKGTTAVCKAAVGGDMVAGQLFHAFLELWVDITKKVTRMRDGVTKEWLFLSSADLQTMSGLSERQISDRAIPKLKKCPFFDIRAGKLTPDHKKQYQIHFDQELFWEEVQAALDPTSEVKEKIDGYTWTKKMVDRKKLPYLFKRLYDGVKGGA